MSFEEWKLHRALHEESEFDAYRSKIESVSNVCLVLFGVAVFIVITAVAFYNLLA
jgi:hypothetical protein